MRIHLITGIIATAMVLPMLTGCSTAAAPNYFMGNYYMAGDQNCASFKRISNTRIICYNKSGEAMATRDALTPEQLRMYHMQQSYQQEQIRQGNLQLEQMNRSLQQSNQQMLQQSQQYRAPQQGFNTPPNSYETRCINQGIYVYCKSN
jgi:hypothetical protein